MRPGQTAPECVFAGHWAGSSSICFNEAGADCPGMPSRQGYRFFRQAVASMRPGQTAPECERDIPDVERGGCRFNEAGADCPGMRRTERARERRS